eukprot:g28569.t1
MGSILTSLEEYKPIDPDDYQSLRAREEEESQDPQQECKKRYALCGKITLFLVVLSLVVLGLIPILKNANRATGGGGFGAPAGQTGGGGGGAGSGGDVLSKYIFYQKNRGAITPKLTEPGTGNPLLWYTLSDVLVGGASAAAVDTSADGGLQFYGVVSAGAGMGFVSCRTDLNGLPANVRAVALTTSGGDSREYKLNIQQSLAGPNSTQPPAYQAAFLPNSKGQTQRMCKTLSEFKAVSDGGELAGAGPLQNQDVLSVGILLDHTRGANRLQKGSGTYPFALRIESVEWLEQPC